MKILAVKFRKDGFYSQPFAFGGEDGVDRGNPRQPDHDDLQSALSLWLLLVGRRVGYRWSEYGGSGESRVLPIFAGR